MRTSLVKTWIILGLGGLVMTGFQNCGGVKFNGPSAGSVDQRSGAGAPVGEGADPTLAEASCDLPPAATGGGANQSFQGTANVPVISNAGFVHLNGITAGDVIVNGAAKVIAQNLAGGLIAAGDEVHALDVAGPLCVTAARVVQLQNIRGATRLLGTSTDGQPASLGPVIDVRDIVIENFESPLVRNVHGHLTLKGSHVRTVQDVTGRIDLADGAVIDHLVDSPGAQVYRDGVPATVAP